MKSLVLLVGVMVLLSEQRAKRRRGDAGDLSR
jgi:hypothetical protein